jgi:hypothetical protein
MGAWDNYDKKTNKKSAWSDYDKSKEPKEGLGKKVLGFGKELVKDAGKTLLIRPAARATEAITRTLAPNSLAAKGYEAMEDSGESQRLLDVDVERQKALGQGGGKQIVGNALETAGWLYGTGKVANLAMEQAAKQGVKKFGTKLAKEGFISTALGSSGSQLSEKGKIDAKQLAKDVAIGTALTPVAGIGLSKVLGKLGSKVDTGIETKVANDIHTQTTGGRISDDTLNYLKKNPIGSDELPVNKDGTVTLYRKGNVESGKPQSYSLKQGYGQVPVNVPKENVLVNYNSSKVDDLYNKSFTKEQIDAGYLNQRKLNKLESEVYAVSPETKIPTEQIAPEIKTTPEVKTQNISKDVNKILQDTPNIEDYQPGTFEDWSKTIRGLDINEAKRVAMGGNKTIQNNIPKNAYLSVMKNIAEETGDVKLAKELAFSDVSSKGGQELVASKIANTDNVTDTLREIRLSKLKRFNVDEKVFNKNADDMVKSIKNQIDNMSSKKSTIQEVREIINDLICK